MFVWAIAVIGGIAFTSVTYVGQFEQESVCMKAVDELKKQNLSSIKVVCVQIPKPAQEIKK